MGVFVRHDGEDQHGEHQDEFAQVRNQVRVASGGGKLAEI
jgi:hypothetical protein